MIIVNRKNGKSHTITEADWDKLGQFHLQNLYKVMDGNNVSPKVTNLNIPKQIVELQQKLKIERPENTTKPPVLPEPKQTKKTRHHG